MRDAFDAPGLNPDSRPELLAALRRAGLDVADTRASSLRALEHPGIVPLLRYKQLAHLFQTNGWAWIDQWVSGGRFRPSYQPAGSATGRWSSNGGGRAVVPGRRSGPRPWPTTAGLLVVADVAQLEPRVLAGHERRPRAGQVGPRRRPLPGDGRRRRGGQPQRRQARPARRDVRRHQRRERTDGRRAHPALPRTPSVSSRRRPVPASGARWCARCWGAGHRTWATRGTATPTTRRSTPTAGPGYRRAYGRFTRNFVVQGTGAEWALCWIADLRNRLWRLGGDGPLVSRPHLVFFLHDEVVVHTPAALADAVVAEANAAAATAAGLLFRDLSIDFPLNVSVVTVVRRRGQARCGRRAGSGGPVASRVYGIDGFVLPRSAVAAGRKGGCLVVLLLTPLVQALLGGRQERHARRVRTGVLLVEVEGPAVHGRHEAVVASGPVRRPAEVVPDLAHGAADLVDELPLAVQVDLHPRQRAGLRGGLLLTSGSARRHVAPLSCRQGAYSGERSALAAGVDGPAARPGPSPLPARSRRRV